MNKTAFSVAIRRMLSINEAAWNNPCELCEERGGVAMLYENAYVLEGTWDELLTHADELQGHRLRVIVLPPEPIRDDAAPASNEDDLRQTARELLKVADTLPREAGKPAGDPSEEIIGEILSRKYRHIGLKV